MADGFNRERQDKFVKNSKMPRFRAEELLSFAALAVVLSLAEGILCEYYDSPPMLSAAILSAIYTAAVLTYLIIRRTFESKTDGDAPAPSELVSVLSESVINDPVPVFICPEGSDKVVWYNRSAATVCGNRKSVTMSELFVEDAGDADDEADSSVKYLSGGRTFSPAVYTVSGKLSRSYTVYVMTDITDIQTEEDKLRGRESAVAYVTVDNLEELLNYEQEDYRSASGETERLLRRWAAEAGGVLKEYQQDRYIFLFEKSHMENFRRSGFDILDKIRGIRVGEASIPITVSMGICAVGNTLAEKEKAAQTALDTALQRGGDQVVVKGDGTVDIYGGKTKMPQKRTKVKARVIANELISHITNASNVLIMAHKYADFDAFGSSVGLARLCMFCGVPVNIVSDLDDSNLDRCRGWLSGEKEYVGMFVDPDFAMDMINSETLLIVTDVNNRNQFESAALFDHCPTTVIIDHHRKTAEYETEPLITYIEPSASAASELVTEMLEQVLPGEELLPREADMLMAGILLDTNQFAKNTGTRTFSAALYLKGRGTDVGEVQELFKTQLSDFQRELKFHSNVEIYRGIAAIATTHEDCTIRDKVPAAKAADKLLSVEGVKASFAIVPIGNEVHISARSSGTINVQLLLEGLQGGGHYDSAGTRIDGADTEEAVAMLKSAIDRYLDEDMQENTEPGDRFKDNKGDLKK